MASKDLYNNIGIVQAVAPQVLTATNTSSGVDLAGFESATVVISTGAIVASGNFTPKLQDSADNSTFADVAAADLMGSFPSALAATTVYKVGYKGSKRYVRSVLTQNSGTSIAASVDIVRAHARSKPVA
ncbi:hypothetical protein FHX10_003225 [Rhizobium sp. BK591]|uniref:hypothetical protein n=1 Tax=Rhizobium sp. BK591 TaxID=2586985 RepID=UPI001615F489|nr:hypothetical protein [Rhizobium sp. BK591]MBB3743726.1 hypothetical protein [Rhizobium sp. BK591]